MCVHVYVAVWLQKRSQSFMLNEEGKDQHQTLDWVILREIQVQRVGGGFHLKVGIGEGEPASRTFLFLRNQFSLFTVCVYV